LDYDPVVSYESNEILIIEKMSIFGRILQEYKDNGSNSQKEVKHKTDKFLLQKKP
jgi:hypothetical protein